MGSRMFWKAQYGKETFGSKGTAVAATRIWPGQISVPDDVSPVYPNHNLAVRVKANESAAFQYLVDGLVLSDEQAAFQSLLMPLATTLKGNITPSEVTPSQGDYLWDFSPNYSTTGDTLDAVTLQYGDDDQAYRTEYCIGKRFLLKGATGANAGVSIESEMFGRQQAKNAFTGGLSIPAWTLMNANLVQLWSDTTWAGLGTTELTNLIRDWEVEIIPGTHPKFLGNSTTFTKHGNGYVEAMLRLTLEGGSSAVALYDLYRARTKRAMRLKVTGPIIGAGTAHSFVFDIWGDLMVTPLAGEQDNNTVYKAAVTNLYDSTAADSIDVKVTTAQNTL